VKPRSTAISISKEKIGELEALLTTFCAQSNTVWALLLSNTGHLVIQRGFLYSFDVLTISALACGVFNSTQELARIVGEKKFNEFLQEGRAISIYYINVSEDFILVSMFDDRTIPGVVKVASEDFSRNAHQLLKS
jgi:predicted regulator of Ras-like GTPase activity (Roadblock/LC7/MglB family)